MSPSYSRTPLAISLLTGVRDAQLDGDEVTGHWQDALRPVRSTSASRTIVEQFLNWADDPASVLRFVQRYGPLSKPRLSESVFRQSIQQWRKRQAELRALWRSGSALGYKIGLREGEMIAIGRNELSLSVEDLSRFLEFEIFLYPAARRRVCERPDCPISPYFIAAHEKTTLCSKVCKAWKQRQHQLKWWAEHGDQWRKKRKHPGKGRRQKARARG